MLQKRRAELPNCSERSIVAVEQQAPAQVDALHENVEGRLLLLDTFSCSCSSFWRRGRHHHVRQRTSPRASGHVQVRIRRGSITRHFGLPNQVGHLDDERRLRYRRVQEAKQHLPGEIRGRRRPTEVATMSRAEALRESAAGRFALLPKPATPRVVYLIHCTFCPHG